MSFPAFVEHSRKTRENLQRFQEETFLHRHHVAKRESRETPPPKMELGPEQEGAIFI